MNFNHKCHFHPQQNINKFCPQKQCTLPLCRECEPIHLEEHAAQHQHVQLLPFSDAYHQAYQAIQDYLSNEAKMIRERESQMESDRQAVIRFIDSYYSNVSKALEQTKGKCHQIEQKLHKLKKGSIKTLIFFFSGDIELNSDPIEFTPLLGRLSKEPKEQPAPQRYHTKVDPHTNVETNNKFEPHTKYEPYKQNHLSRDYHKIHSLSTAKLPQGASLDQGNVFNRIQQINIADRSREKTRKSIFDNAKRSNVTNNEKPQLKSPSNKYAYNINPVIENQEQTDVREITRHSPKLHKDYSGTFKFENKQKTGTEQQAPVSFQNRYKFSGAEKIDTYKQREDRIYKQSSIGNRQEEKQNTISGKVLKPSDLEIKMPKEEPISKPNSNQAQVNSQRMRSFSQTNFVSNECRSLINNQNKNEKNETKQDKNGEGFYDLKKQILPPQEIRKMLEKRIEERNRILSIKKSQNYGVGQPQGAGKKGWQTRDSIINQIYNDHKN